MSKRDLEFIYEMGALRHIDRQWKRFLLASPQNTVEHTFRVVWTSLILSKMEEAGDLNKIIKMALVHDIVESRTGDTDYLMRPYVERNDEKAIKAVLKDTSLEKDFTKIFVEYEKRESIEAKIVKDADNLDVDLETREQEVKGMKPIKEWKRFRETHMYKKFYTASARKLYRQIEKSNPNDWHTKAQNRFRDFSGK